MAITGHLTIEKDGQTHEYPECYARIMTVVSTKFDSMAIVNFYASQDERLQELDPLKNGQYTFATVNGILWPALYTNLKTLPEFAGWVDVFESVEQGIGGNEVQPTQAPAEA